MTQERIEGFTDKARRALTLAQREAVKLCHPVVGTEHLLLGLAAERDSVASIALKHQGAEPQKLRAGVTRLCGTGNTPVTGEIGLTPAVKTVIEKAILLSKELRHPCIGTEHLLLALLDSGENSATQVLECTGINPELVKNQVVLIIGQGATIWQGSGIKRFFKKMLNRNN